MTYNAVPLVPAVALHEVAFPRKLHASRPFVMGRDVAPRRQKLSDRQVREIRRRVGRGELQTELAALFGVNRRTIRRRLDALEAIEAENAAALLARQTRRELRKQRRDLAPQRRGPTGGSGRETRGWSIPYVDWLETPKNLFSRALAEARGLTRLRSPDGKEARWVERSEAEQLIVRLHLTMRGRSGIRHYTEDTVRQRKPRRDPVHNREQPSPCTASKARGRARLNDQRVVATLAAVRVGVVVDMTSNARGPQAGGRRPT